MLLINEELDRNHERLASSLKRLRRDAGYSAHELGRLLGWSQSKVSKIENRRTRPAVKDVHSWLQQCGAPEQLSAELVELASLVGAQTTSWGEANLAGFAATQKIRARREAEATSIAIYQSEVVPGLFQTADYARHLLLTTSSVTPETVGAAVIARLDRQAVLFDESKTIEAVITEIALRWRPGGVAVQLAQLDRLVSLANLPNVDIGVVSREQQELAILLHSFVLLRCGDLTEVQVETLTAEVAVREADALVAYEDMFKHQRSYAVRGDELVELIQAISADLRARNE